MRTTLSAFLYAILLAFPASTFAQEPPSSDRPPPDSARSAEAATISSPPTIDGYLDEIAWMETDPSTDFWVVEQQVWPDEQTEFSILTDGKFLYFGLMMSDSQPDEISAIEAVGDGGLGYDDQVAIQISASGDDTDFSIFSVNARGTQSDNLANGTASNIGGNGDWEVAVVRTAQGWIAEFAIPYSMLDYPAGAERFILRIKRYHNKSQQWSLWADVTPQSKPEEMGQLTGIDPPYEPAGNTSAAMPVAVAGTSSIYREGLVQDEILTGDTAEVTSTDPDAVQAETQIDNTNTSDNEPATTLAQKPATPDRPPPGSSRSIEPATISRPPVIDGYLDDFIWIENNPSTDFWVTQQQVWPDEQTEVTVLTDGKFIYFGLMMYDSQPDQIMAIEAVRDRGLGYDDQISIQINSSGDHTEISKFSVNARGTQSDRLAGGSASNISWKGDWDVAVAKTDSGWSAEFAIPYSMLKYPAGTNQFSFNVARYHNNSRQWSFWADTTPQDRIEEMGQLTGINPPVDVERSTWTIMPFALVGKDVIDREGELQDEMFTAGVDIRYTPNSDTTGVISLNPDFTQVETQVASANFSYNEQVVAEPRVFFQEGETYFGEDLRFFYSPRIPDFIGGGKIFGQTASLQYGSFITASTDSRTDAVGRLSYAFTPTYSTSAIVTATDREDLRGATVGLSGSGRQEIGTYWDIDFGAVSNTIEIPPEDEEDIICLDNEDECDGFMVDGRVGWQGNYWGTGASFDKYDKEFNPANGLIRDDRLGTEAWDVFINQYRDYGNTTVSETTFDIVRTLRKTEDGRDQYDGWYYGGSLEWVSFARTGLSYNQGDYRPLTGDAPGDFADDDAITDDFFWTASLDLNTRGSRINFYSAYSSGELAGGDYDYGYVYLFARPTYNTSISINVERTELAYPDFISVTDQIITDAGWDITPTDSITFRHIYFDLSEDIPQFPEFSSSTKEQYWRLGYRRVVRSGLDIFLLYDDEPFADDPSISAKLLWTIN